MSEVHTIATWAQAVSRALDAEGFASTDLLREAGIDPAWLADGERRIPVAMMSRLWRAARRVSGDDCFGLRVARHCFPTDFHGLLFAIQSSVTIAEALQRVVRYSAVVTTSANLELIEQGSRYRLFYRPMPGVQAEQIATEALIACAVRLTRQSWAEMEFITAVELARPRPADVRPWENLLGCPVRFDAPCNAIEYAAQPLAQVLRTGNREVASGLDRVMNAYLQRLSPPDLAGRVRDAIVRQLPHGEVQQGVVAEALGMSVRNLHRHLQKQATSFKELLDDSRRRLAFDYLREAECSVNEVCYRLGFNEPSSFNRAFRRWTGETPGQWRRHALQPATRLPGVRREQQRAALELAV
ncbi:AraC family transcriptional regulator [Pseudomonas sp. Gutcm_11s]|uniref:AraC family transcriptional regulator n=1 Tax=Pseudomonas sp. Gutcm_11s TaxID=3026088 RepID=UPI00235E44B1|nr:AraC family transcriptional regulator [Pseudomonas sp. Gutcm_11s]MDD0841587.1 AraC family transcriptional regulator [Pseudomonas sp. Gutcm_11s]